MTESRNRPPACRRCGTCCKKGGPGLHIDDASLVHDGRIPLRDLTTIRAGEQVFDNVAGLSAMTTSDIIRIRPRSRYTTVCRYLDHTGGGQHGCHIYDDRPLECRLLNCSDTRPIEAAYCQDHLTRAHLLAEVPVLLDLVTTHGQHCDDRRLAQQVRQWHEGSKTVEDEICAAVRYDTVLRQMIREKGSPDPDLLDFLFGRPLVVTLPPLGIRLVNNNGTYRLVDDRSA